MNDALLTVAPVAIGIAAYIAVGWWVYHPTNIERFSAPERFMLTITAFALVALTVILGEIALGLTA